MSTRPTPGPNHTVRWHPLETTAAPAVTATATVVLTLKDKPASCCGRRGVGANPGREGRGTGESRAGEEERPNAIAYNNAYVEGRWGLFQNVRAPRSPALPSQTIPRGGGPAPGCARRVRSRSLTICYTSL